MVKMVDVVSSKGYEYLDDEDERKDDKKKRLAREKEKEYQHQHPTSEDDKLSNNNKHNTSTIAAAAAAATNAATNAATAAATNATTTTSNANSNSSSSIDKREKYKGNLFLVLEYVSHDLSGILDMGHRFTPIQSKYIFQQLLSVLEYMHKEGYVHRDLKSSNILLDGKFKVKLADFGLARCMDES